MITPQALAITEAIIEVETGGDCSLKGGSGEHGCAQYLPSTWKAHSKQIFGEVVEQTPINEKYVLTHVIVDYLEQGYTPYQIALIHNGGEPVEKSGVNKFGIAFDTARYARNVTSYLD